MLKEIQNLPEIYAAHELSVPEEYKGQVQLFRIRYRSDECEVEGFVALPMQENAPWPGLIFNRGGNRSFGALKGERILKYAAEGYAVFGSQYRGNCGGTGREAFGGRDVYDVIHLIDIALKLSFVRKEGIYMIGHSRGGMMTYRACALDKRIRAAVVSAGVTNCFTMYNRFHDGEYDMREDCEQLIGGTPHEMPEEYRMRSAVYWAEDIIPPILIAQGTADWRVIPEQSYEMDKALTIAGKEHCLIIYEGADHSLAGTTFFQDAMAWLAAHPL